METYSNLHFAAVNTLKSTDYNELKDAVKSDYQYNSHTVDFSQLDITDEGYLQWFGNENQMTQAAFKALCRRFTFQTHLLNNQLGLLNITSPSISYLG